MLFDPFMAGVKKMDIGKQSRSRSDTAERGVWSSSGLFALKTEISIKHGNNKLTRPPSIRNGPVQNLSYTRLYNDGNRLFSLRQESD